ncbi:glycerol channel [Recurvomyces mirabilis]|uniref:Glycerol channel n=1 Tax=Recurvomyces mirabilis TaxID=574656 RepID=A0AAE1C3D0_9PEZI|nr:glycerol channel [Recurvomyces mirabilis]KAK5153870.1 glycerol channel [Recurvomyces mirabilis]
MDEKMDDGLKIQHMNAPPSPDSLHVGHHEYKQSNSSAGTTIPYPDGQIHDADVKGSPVPYAEHGVLIDRTRTGLKKKPLNSGLRWPRIRRIFREPFSEFMGTFILIMFGDGVVAQVVLSNGTKGDYQSISWGWGIGVMLGVYASGISGAHINPAVTFANCLYRKFPWRKFPIYMLAQVLGAMCAAAVVYGNYKSAIDTFEGGAGIRTVPGYSPNASAGIFCTYPAAFMSNTGQFFSEFIASTLLMFCIYALKDDGNIGAGNLTPLGLFFIIFGIGACFGWETGYAINLARDFGPRLVSYMIGYGPDVWRAGNYYFWVPMVAPFFGCAFGGFLYDLLLFTGESPINTPYLGLYRFIPGMRHMYDGVSFNPEDVKEDDPV